MKKTFTFILLFAVLLFSFCSCIEIDTGDTQDEDSDSAQADKSSNSKLGDYEVVIQSARLATDYEGKPVIIVQCKFTNNGDDPASFEWSLDYAAYQDGIGLNECYFVDESENYSSDNQTKEIKKGATLTVEIAYELNDTTTDVEVEISEYLSFSDKKITKSFSID